MLQAQSNPNYKNKHYSQSPVHFAIKANVKPAILLLLVQYGGSLILRDKINKRPIDYVNSDEMRDTINMLKMQNEDAFVTPRKQRVGSIFFDSNKTPSKAEIVYNYNHIVNNYPENKNESNNNNNNLNVNNNLIKSQNINLNYEMSTNIKEPYILNLESKFDTFNNNNKHKATTPEGINDNIDLGALSEINPLDTLK